MASKLNPDMDGVDHINIYSKGKTELGRMLSNFAKTPFVHPVDGQFMSIEGYWYWLSTKDDNLRHKWGFDAKAYGRQVKGSDWSDDPEFKSKIKQAITIKITQDKDLARQLRESTLPFVHYYVFKGHVVVPKDGEWIIDHILELREARNAIEGQQN